MPDDKLTMALAEIRMRGYRNGATGALSCRLSDCAAIDVPRLLTAATELLELHKITEDSYSQPRCSDCSYERGYTVTPGMCPVRKAITRALLGEDATDG